MKWRPIIRWTLPVIGILIVAGVVAGILFLKSASFNKFAIRAIINSVNESTGSQTEIGKFDFQLSTLTARLYDITVHGREGSGQPPLLHIDKLTVGLKIESVLYRKVSLKELSIDHPIAYLLVDREGKSNLPQRPQTPASSNTSVFDIAAGHVLLTRGEITYNDATVPIDADLYDLRTEIGFDPIETRYRGAISYDRGRIQYLNEPVFSHTLEAKFSATPVRLSLESGVLKLGSSKVSVHADLTNYRNPTVDGQFEISIHGQDFSTLVQPSVLVGDVSLTGKVHYDGSGGSAPLRSISIDGQISSDELSASSHNGRLDLRHIRGRYQLANGTLQARDVDFETLGGKVFTNVEIQNLDATAAVRMRTTLRGISLRAVHQALRIPEVRRANLAAEIDGNVDASWTGNVKNLRARTDLVLKARSESGEISSTSIPVNGAIHAVYDNRRDAVTFRETTLGIPSAKLGVNGELSNRSNLLVQANTNDLHQLAVLFSAVRGGQALPMEIGGSASANAVVRGSLQRPQLSGQFRAQNLQVEGSEWKSAKFDIEASPTQISLHDAVLVSARKGQASLNATAALKNWSYIPTSPIAVNLSVQRLSLADLQRLANVHYPVSGDLSMDVAVHGTQLNPIGKGSAKVVNAHAYNEPIQHLAATFHADKSSMTSTFELNLPAGSAKGTLSYTPQTKAYTVRLDAPEIVLQKLQTVQAKNLGVAGTVTLSASGEGTLDNPQLIASIDLPELILRDKSISKLKGQLQITNQHAQLTFDSEVAQASLHSRADVSLSGNYYTEAILDTTGIPLGPLVAMYSPSLPQDFQGETELHATLKGPLKDRSKIEAHLTIPTLKAQYQSLTIGATSPIRVDYSNSVVTLQPAEFRGSGTSVRVQGRVPFGGTTTPSFDAQGSIDVRILQIIDPDLKSSGTLALDVRAAGTSNEPTVQGQVRLQNIAVSTPAVPLGIQSLNGILDINNNTLQISRLTAEAGGGQISMGGSISYKPNLQFNITMQSDAVRLRYPNGLRTVLDSSLVLSGTKDASTLNGRVLIDTLSFTPDFDLAKFSDQFNGSAVPAQPGLADNIKLAVGIQSKNSLSANSSQISVEGQVNLQVVGTAANPVITGRTNLTSGELFYRNVRYQLQRGIITFDNPTETEPTLNMSVATTVEQYNLTLNLRGPFDKLTTSYTSDPPLATADIINLIANGQTTQEAAAAGQTTDSMIASQVAGQVTGGIQHLAGISSLQIDPLLGGNNQNPSARVAIQQRVTKNFLFTFSTDLSQPGSEVIQGDYQINKHWSVSVTRDEVGGVSVDGKYHTKF
ncbi:MAG: translocation/assembly module TamB domain-containing protein [Candidatus Sulfotelmatobacter sp.]